MVKWDLDHLNGMAGYHLDSEPHMRIQVLDVPPGERDLWLMDHGELLLISINGNCIVRTADDKCQLNQHEQVFLKEGEKFSISRNDQHQETFVQAIWTPGLNPCKKCWEVDNRFFANKS